MRKYYNFMDYPTQLESPEWQIKRNHILERDQNRCQLCGKGKSNRTKILGKYYNFGLDYSYTSIQESDIIKTQFSISEFKEFLHWERTNICQSESDYMVAINDKGIIGIVDINLKGIVEDPNLRDNICINLVRHKSGMLFYMLSSIDSNKNNLKIPVPYFREDPISLNVHHKRYILQKKAWEYNDDDLVTLCNECHEKIHKVLSPKVYSDNNGYMEEVPLIPCSRCQGTGYFPEYRHVENGVCFRCRGARFEELIQHKEPVYSTSIPNLTEDDLPF